jgi:hypothetical protein
MIDLDSAATPPVRPSATHIDAFAARLGGEGYTPKTVDDKCELLAKLGHASVETTSIYLQAMQLKEVALAKTPAAEAHASRYRPGRRSPPDLPQEHLIIPIPKRAYSSETLGSLRHLHPDSE